MPNRIYASLFSLLYRHGLPYFIARLYEVIPIVTPTANVKDADQSVDIGFGEGAGNGKDAMPN
jgi:hypothetical protein